VGDFSCQTYHGLNLNTTDLSQGLLARCQVHRTNIGPHTGTDTPTTNQTVSNSSLPTSLSSKFTKIQTETSTRILQADSPDKSLTVRELAQIQYQICITPLNPLLLLPCHQSLPRPARTRRAAPSGRTASPARTSPTLTNPAPPSPANQENPVTPLRPKMIFMNRRFPFGNEMGNLSTFSGVSWVLNQTKKKWLKHMFLELS